MIPQISEFYEKLDLALRKEGYFIGASSPVPYGLRIDIEDNHDVSIPVTIYFSKKKGLSTVIGGSPKNPLKTIVQPIIHKVQFPESVVENKISWNSWVGTDESGKGDYFGPLVVCGFISTPKIDDYLRRIGIADSKKLTDKRIDVLANTLRQKLPGNFRIMKLNPEKYNVMYQNFTEQKKKLNDLLAWMHSRIIMDLYNSKYVQGAIIDKFASQNTIFRSLKGFKEIPSIIEPKAESYPAVAAASIIARQVFVQEIAAMENKFGMPFQKGASKIVDQQIRNYIEKFGVEKLNLVGKIHFVNTQKAQS